MTDATNRVGALQRQLRDLQGSRQNRLTLFGSWQPDLHQRIEQAARRGRFHHAPVGPIGMESLSCSAYNFVEGNNLLLQCSPYQAVTGKIYRLKQHFLPPATA